MAFTETPNEAGGERCVSYGRGGAGNLRRPSQIHNDDGIVDVEEQRQRQSSVWSTTSSNGEGRRASIVKAAAVILGRRSSTGDEETGTETKEEEASVVQQKQPSHRLLTSSEETAHAKMTMELSKYEFLQELRYVSQAYNNEPNHYVNQLKNSTGPVSEELMAKAKMLDMQVQMLRASGRFSRIWMARRRRDDKLFLARAYEDRNGLVHSTKESLLRLLNHPNLVSLVDVVHDTEIAGGDMDYTIWEYCDRGSLSQLLGPSDGIKRVEVPESLCWHVLDGISQALLWLHFGNKFTFPFDRHMRHDEDWHPVLIKGISPSNIYFCAPERDETYGDVKLACFKSASVVATSYDSIIPHKANAKDKYQPPEIRKRILEWSMAAEVWSLGAVLYHMMVGSAPVDTEIDISYLLAEGATSDDFMVKALPDTYSPELRDIVLQMLTVDRNERPTAADLSVEVNQGMRIWRENTPEGRRYVGKGEGRKKLILDER